MNTKEIAQALVDGKAVVKKEEGSESILAQINNSGDLVFFFTWDDLQDSDKVEWTCDDECSTLLDFLSVNDDDEKQYIVAEKIKYDHPHSALNALTALAEDRSLMLKDKDVDEKNLLLQIDGTTQKLSIYKKQDDTWVKSTESLEDIFICHTYTDILPIDRITNL